MKKDIWYGQHSARFIYLSYKDTPYYSLVIIVFLILVSILLIFNLIIPQTQNWLSLREEAISARARIDMLKKNLFYISNLNKTVLENNRQIAVRALPADKNFEDIIYTIAISSAMSGVSINDFNFALGPIASSSGNLPKDNSGLDTIPVTLSLNGSINSIKNFIALISEKMPLSEIISVDTGKEGSSISLIFYSKTYHPINIPDTQPIQPISAPNVSMLGKLSAWDQGMNASTQETPVAPDANIPLF